MVRWMFTFHSLFELPKATIVSSGSRSHQTFHPLFELPTSLHNSSTICSVITFHSLFELLGVYFLWSRHAGYVKIFPLSIWASSGIALMVALFLFYSFHSLFELHDKSVPEVSRNHFPLSTLYLSFTSGLTLREIAGVYTAFHSLFELPHHWTWNAEQPISMSFHSLFELHYPEWGWE